ncbi:ATP-binding cassette sub-family C member 4-like [Antedon mediterranea]|uniref:ATP-binding cassette sub-family C member 4-like n=1 Tax=Antedon mediterranea TaxID=105859 RepID=UPI003AF6AD62
MYFEADSEITSSEAYTYAVIIVLLSAIANTITHPYYFYTTLLGMRLRIAFTGLIYRKALRLSSLSLGKTTIGQVVNILSNDVNRFDQALIFVSYTIVAPLQLIVVTVLLYYQLGPSCFAGMAVIVLMTPLQGWFGTLFSQLRTKTAVLTDERVRLMNEIISGMRVIKMYAWEKPFSFLVSESRRKEIQKVRKSSQLRAANLSLFFTTISLVSFATFVVYSLTGNTLTASKVYFAIPLFIVVRQSSGLYFPYSIATTMEGFVSLRRMQDFLLLKELAIEDAPTNISKDAEDKTTKDPQVTMTNISASWDEDDGEKALTMVLKDINLNVQAGELLAVVGPVGCGKSSLLMTIMREVPHMTGNLDLSGRIAYSAQLPWIFSGTVKDNIIFGLPFDKQRFDHAIRVCALKKDLDILPKEEETLVGERGVKLSGGQRARIGLARAVYNDKDVYLLDDPLSAVDTQVGRHLFDVCIKNALKDKPCILVTHQLQYLENVDRILVMKEGEVAGYGTYTELQSSGIDFASLLKKPEEQEQKVVFKRRGSSFNVSSIKRSQSVVSGQSIEPICDETDEEEFKATGNISYTAYGQYFRAGGGASFIAFYILINLIVQALFNVSDWWLAYWVLQEETALNEFNELDSTNSTASPSSFEFDSNWYIYTFLGLTASLFVMSFLRSFLTFSFAITSSENLHNKMFNAVVHAPMRFFDANPTGRILNRFAKDIGLMDELLPLTVADIVQISLMVLGAVLTVAIFNPVVLLVVFPLVMIMFLVRLYFLHTSREVKRMEGITRSPIFSHLSATLQGLSTVRAFQAQKSFTNQFDGYQDHHSQAWYLFLTTSRYFGIWLDWLALVFVTAVTFGCIILFDVSETLNAGTVGLSLTYALTLLSFFQWVVRQSAELENLMTSTERVLEYTNVKSEAALESHSKPPSDWPKDGSITFEDLSLSYYDGGPLVLKNLNCNIHAKEKVGIAGRTGAGKSSIMTALLRLAEPSGTVTIDGVLINDLGLHDLRNSISIIPQDPVLFSGSLRRNLDPFEEHTEVELWEALEEVQLKTFVSEFPEKLEAEVTEGGTNFSVGQRQLLCLARAILRHTRILIVDEATANVDIKTDTLIQATIREKFEHCTVLTIAHRLNTIMDSDRIMILDQGRIAEFDEPFVLLQKNDGFLKKMVSKCGQTEAANLLDIAREKYNKNNSNKKTILTENVHTIIEENDVNVTLNKNVGL